MFLFYTIFPAYITRTKQSWNKEVQILRVRVDLFIHTELAEKHCDVTQCQHEQK